jgi:hypothetical protein
MSVKSVQQNHFQMNLQFSEKQAIQFCYPETEPVWENLSEPVLIELILDYENEPSCATSALYALSQKNHLKAVELAKWLLTEENSDEWLKKSATSIRF